MSQRYIVAFKKVSDINNFHPLFPVSEYRGITFVFQRDPLITVTDNKINTNFDLLITTRHDPYVEQLLEDHRLVKIDRVPKEVQSLRLAKKAKELGLKNYLPNIVYYFQDLDLSVEALTEGKTYVVKPRMGARGLGMFLIDTKKIKLSSFLDVLSPLLFSNSESFPTNEKKSKYIETIVTHRDMNNGVQFFTGEESFDFESAEAITDWGIVIQEHIPNITEEYRLIVSNGYIHSIRKRGIKDQNLRQAIPSGLIDAPVITREEFTTYLKSKGIEFNEVESLTQVAGDAPHSFDLFITEDNKWGFFEYSNQFCTQDIPTELLKEIHLSYLHKLLVPDYTFLERVNKDRDYDDVFLGEVSSSELITGDALASLVGVTEGTSQNSNTNWLKFRIDGKIVFVSKKNIRYSISWDDLDQANVVDGSRIITIKGRQYRIGLLKGLNPDPSVPYTQGYDVPSGLNSEWNRLLYPVADDILDYPKTSQTIDNWAHFPQDDSEDGLNITEGDGRRSWCQEIDPETSSLRVHRGYGSITYLCGSTSSNTFANYGWRVRLELVEE